MLWMGERCRSDLYLTFISTFSLNRHSGSLGNKTRTPCSGHRANQADILTAMLGSIFSKGNKAAETDPRLPSRSRNAGL